MLQGAFQTRSDKFRILLVSPDTRLHAAIQVALSTNSTYKLTMIEAGVSDMDRYSGEVRGASLLLVDFDPSNFEDISALRELMSGIASGIPVIAISGDLNPQGVREVLQLHVNDWIPKSAGAESIIQACMRAIESGRLTKKTTDAACFTFLPASGGVGATTLAIEAAYLIARKAKSFRSTCLIDLDFQAGAMADHLDLSPSLHFNEIGPSPDRLDRQLLEVMLSRRPSGLALLATTNHLLDPVDVDPEIIAKLLGLASSEFENIVIDLPNTWLPFAENVLSGSNRVFIIAELTVPGIRRARALIDAINDRFDGQIELQVIINKYASAMFGNALSKKDAVSLFGKQFAGLLPRREKLVKEAIDRGVALFEIDKRNRIDKLLSKILFDQ